jgi:hypothetical protein
VNGTEHVVVSEKVVKAQVLDRSPNSPNSARISSKLVLRVDDADLHELQSARLESLIQLAQDGRFADGLSFVTAEVGRDR